MTTASATAICTTCDLGLEHCHGLLVEHDDGTATCLDGCGGPRAVHDDVAACGEVGPGCCGAPAAERVPAPAPARPAAGFRPARATRAAAA
jgi:hypothetical protein